MGFLDKLRGEVIDIIEWLDASNDTLVYRFERYGNEIKWHAKLVVREGQMAVFINEGQLADVFSPGTYTLDTKNLPILATLKGWKYGFESPFKAEVYFASTRQFTDLKWGTKNPVMLRDAEFGPVRLRAFGSYAMRIQDPAAFIREIVGTDGDFTTSKIHEQLRNMVITRFTDLLGESKIPILDLAANYNELSEFIQKNLGLEYGEYGLELTKFLVENISLPPEVEEALDKRSSMGILGDLNAYTKFQAANAMEAAAENTANGMAGAGVGLGAGMAMANQMTGSFQQQAPQQPAAMPPPVPVASFYVAVNGQQTGPFDLNTLMGQKNSGQFTEQSMVWMAGMPNWLPASQVQALAPLFQAPPPPPPPAPMPPPPPAG
ncbi:SPFH domain-containing protein [Kiritimatiellota bacterium B12222]|nr:SPFH domain-containing protein [Kiritimatiellota bacterium B12222]